MKGRQGIHLLNKSPESATDLTIEDPDIVGTGRIAMKAHVNSIASDGTDGSGKVFSITIRA